MAGFKDTWDSLITTPDTHVVTFANEELPGKQAAIEFYTSILTDTPSRGALPRDDYR